MTTTTKIAKVKKVTNAKTEKENAEIKKTAKVDLNADLLARLNKINTETLKHSVSSKKSIYKYSDELIKLNDESKFKTFRKQLRKQKYNLCADILKLAKDNNKKDLELKIKEFILFYKTNFLINDFSLENFSNTEKNKEIYSIALQIVREAKVKE